MIVVSRSGGLVLTLAVFGYIPVRWRSPWNMTVVSSSGGLVFALAVVDYIPVGSLLSAVGRGRRFPRRLPFYLEGDLEGAALEGGSALVSLYDKAHTPHDDQEFYCCRVGAEADTHKGKGRRAK